jgi:hypothetical protein
MSMTRNVLTYPNREDVISYLRWHSSKIDIKPFKITRRSAVHAGHYIEMYVEEERIAFEDCVYSTDSEVIEAVKDVARELDSRAKAWADERKAREILEREKAVLARETLFRKAAKQWKKFKRNY